MGDTTEHIVAQPVPARDMLAEARNWLLCAEAVSDTARYGEKGLPLMTAYAVFAIAAALIALTERVE